MDKFTEVDTIEEELKIIQMKDFMIRDNNIKQTSLKTSDDFIDIKYLEENLVLDDAEVDENCFYDDFDIVGVTIPYKERVQIKIVDDLEFYRQLYMMPPINIGNKDWDTLFDVMYDFFVSKNMEERFLTDMMKLNRYSVARTLLNAECFFGIDSYIESINYLECVEITQEDINSLKEKLNDKINGCKKIIDFNKFKNRKRNI